MKKLLFLLFISKILAQSNVAFDLSNSFISYDGKHPAHSWTGISKQIEGKFILNEKDFTKSTVELFVPMFSFDSKNSNRDSNMLDVVEEYFYPYVSFKSKNIEITDEGFNVIGDISFHGITKEFSIPITKNIEDNKIIIDSLFSIYLTDFKIKRPALLTIKIRDRVDLEFHLEGLIERIKQ